MRVIAMGGEPASGKSVIVKQLKGDRKTKRFEHGQLKGEIDKGRKLIYLGIYESKIGEDSFCGTDRLSMSVQPDAVEFVKKAKKKYVDYTILFEGDRLFNKKFLDVLDKFDLATIVLKVDDKTLESRHNNREGDNQSDKFLKGRKTKIRNIVSDRSVIIMEHQDSYDTNAIVKFLKTLIKAEPDKFSNLVNNMEASKEERRSFSSDVEHKFW